MGEKLVTKLKIKDLAIEDRPREKMLLKGAFSLSDAELLGILISSGNKSETAVELAQRILHSASNNLNVLGKLDIKDLVQKFKGIGEAKAITILAALELGRRRKQSENLIRPQIRCSQDAYNIFAPMLMDIPHEEMWMLLLNRSNKVIGKVLISKGGIVGTVVDIRLIIKEAINALATGIILCHNHPSGNLYPSKDDDNITSLIKKATSIMDIKLMDHLILSDNGYYSYQDEGRFTDL